MVVLWGKLPGRATAWLCNGAECGIRFDNPPDKDGPEYLIKEHDLFSYDCMALTWSNDE